MAKISMLIQSLGGGGAERICLTLANGFVEQGKDVELVVLSLKNAVYQNKLNQNVTLVNLQADRTRHAFFKLVSYLKVQKPDKVLVFNYHVALLLIIIKKMYGFKTQIISRTISTLSLRHKNDPLFFRRYMMQTLTKMLYKKADKIIAQSYGMKEDLVENFQVKPEHVVVIHNPVNADIENFAINDHTKKEYILCVGRLENVKAFHYAIKAFAALVNDYPDLRLKFVGQGSKENDLKSLSAQLGVSDKIDFEGFSDKIIPYYTQARVTLLTSLYEGFPNVLVESIALGTPVVAFDCQSGPREIIQNDINGYLVRYQDTDDLIGNLKKALNKEWDINAVKKTAHTYASSTIVRQYLDLLEGQS